MKILKKVLIIAGSVLLVLAIAYILFLCYLYSQKRQAEEKQVQANQQLVNSLAANGQHGYHAFWFIVGRIRKTQIDGPVLHVKADVVYLDSSLVKQHLTFRIIDEKNFSISYTRNGQTKTLKAEIGTVLKDENIEMKISYKNEDSENGLKVQAQYFKEIVYELEVWKY